jgi:RNAse (barnase) inhibitor barstar
VVALTESLLHSGSGLGSEGSECQDPSLCERTSEVRELTLEGGSWTADDDVYDAFFKAVGAPVWHGRNFDALNDSIAGGDINQVEVPYRIVIRNFDRVGDAAKKMANDFVDLIHDLAIRGTPVEIVVSDSD